MAIALEDARRRSSSPAQTSGSARLLPHNLEAEESLLGAMLLSREAIASAAEIVNTEDFYRPAHGHIYDAIVGLYAAGEPADPVTVADELRRAGLYEMIGGSVALVNLQAGTPTSTNAAFYARIIEEHSLLRRVIGVAGEISEEAYSLPEDVTAMIDRAESRIFTVAQRRTTDTMAPIRELLGQNLDRLEMLYDRGESITGISSGYMDLDEKLNGLQPNALYIVGARPAMGKSAFALGMAGHAALVENRPVVFFSLEMGHMELTQRLLCAEAKVDSSRMRNGRLHADDWPKITSAVGRLAEAPLYIDDNPHLTVMEIRGKARRLKAKLGDLGLIVIDYLQLMSGGANGKASENRQVEISEISRGLKILARELEVPVVALSQLSRTLESRADKRPMLSDLRESGALEQDADVVMFLYRDEIYNTDSPDRGTAEVIIGKHRAGPTGTSRLAFLDHYTKFANMAKGI
jgi:replicative DNA helicase